MFCHSRITNFYYFTLAAGVVWLPTKEIPIKGVVNFCNVKYSKMKKYELPTWQLC